MQIKSNPGYNKLLAWWSGQGEKPSEQEAYDGVMQLAAATRLENTVIKRDVIDALIRQPFSHTTLPFKPNRISNNMVLNAVDYDLGRNGLAYFDTDTADYHISDNNKRGGNRGRIYRNDGVDIAAETGTSTFFVTHTQPGEWLQYTIHASKAGAYTITLNCNTEKSDARLSLLVNGKQKGEPVLIPSGKDWNSLELKNVAMTKGKNTLRVYFNSEGVNLKTIGFTEAR